MISSRSKRGSEVLQDFDKLMWFCTKALHNKPPTITLWPDLFIILTSFLLKIFILNSRAMWMCFKKKCAVNFSSFFPSPTCAWANRNCSNFSYFLQPQILSEMMMSGSKIYNFSCKKIATHIKWIMYIASTAASSHILHVTLYFR